MEDIILVGYGGHALSIADSIEKAGKYRIIGFTDPKPPEKSGKYEYLGTDEVLPEYYKKGVRFAAVCIGFMGNGFLRDCIFIQLKQIGFQLPVIVDESAVIAGDVQIGEGSYIGKGAIINAGAGIGKMSIVNTGSIVEHENRIGDFSHIAVGAVLCGNVVVGDHTFVGANATIIQGRHIGTQVVVGAGSIVLRNIEDGEKVYGTVSCHQEK